MSTFNNNMNNSCRKKVKIAGKKSGAQVLNDAGVDEIFFLFLGLTMEIKAISQSPGLIQYPVFI